MEYLIHLATLFTIYAILGLSLNLVVGYTGLLSLTHAAFYGLGAYATALLLTHASWNFFLALLVGMLVSAAAAFLIGVVLSKFRDDYYALASLGFNVIVFSIMLNWQSLTRGPMGIPGIPKPSLEISDWKLVIFSRPSFLVLAVLFALVVYAACYFITRSSFGRALKAIREDEKALQVFGYKTHHYKLAVFVISAAMAAIAGSFFASYITFINPSTFTINESIFILVIIILGGLANLKGSILGALFLVLLPEVLRFVGFPESVAAQMRQVIYGLILVLLMMYRPQGLMGEYKL